MVSCNALILAYSPALPDPFTRSLIYLMAHGGWLRQTTQHAGLLFAVEFNHCAMTFSLKPTSLQDNEGKCYVITMASLNVV